MWLLPLPVPLTQFEYPWILPAFHWKMIYGHDDKDDILVYISLSFFSLAKVILVAKGISKSTLKSIGYPWENPDSVVE